MYVPLCAEEEDEKKPPDKRCMGDASAVRRGVEAVLYNKARRAEYKTRTLSQYKGKQYKDRDTSLINRRGFQKFSNKSIEPDKRKVKHQGCFMVLLIDQ